MLQVKQKESEKVFLKKILRDIIKFFEKFTYLLVLRVLHSSLVD